jgi:O-antigen biosynthesis protein WbqP
MSFIGPRALIESEVKEFAPQIPYFSLRHSIRPGITGWAQVNGRDDIPIPKKVEFDEYAFSLLQEVERNEKGQ